MATQVQFRRGTTAETASFTGASGEITVDLTKHVCVVHDAIQVGGYPLMLESGVNSALSLGTLSNCSLKFLNDPNTGFFSPGPDQLTLVTGGVARITVDSSGAVSIPGNLFASNLSFTQAGSGAVSRTVDSKLKDVVSVKDFGAVGDGVTDDTSKIQNAINYASAAEKQLLVNSGTYLTGQLTCSTSLEMRGEGDAHSIFRFTGGTYGLTVTLGAFYSSCSIRDMGFETTGTTGNAVHINYTVAGFADRNDERVELLNLRFVGANQANNGWDAPLKLTNINGGRYSNLWMIGRNAGTDTNNEADNTVSPAGIIITGLAYPTDHTFDAPTFYSFDKCFVIDGATEGVSIENSTAVNVGSLVDWQPTAPFGGRPMLKALSCHVNSYKKVINAQNLQQLEISGGLFYHNPGATSNFVGLDLFNVIDATILANQFVRYVPDASAATTDAIKVDGSSTANIIIDSNIFGGRYTRLDTGITVANAVPNSEVCIGPNNNWNGTYRVADISVPGPGLNMQIQGRRGLLVRNTNAQSIPNSTVTSIDWDSPIYDPLKLFTSLSTQSSFTIPTKFNIYLIDVNVTAVFNADNSGVRLLQIIKNGSVIALATANATTTLVSALQIAQRISVTGGDVIAVQVVQDSGGALDIQGGGLANLSIDVIT